MIYTEEFVRERIGELLEAQRAILISGKSYKIGSRELRRADLDEISKLLRYWENRLAVILSGGRRVKKTMRITPRDL